MHVTHAVTQPAYRNLALAFFSKPRTCSAHSLRVLCGCSGLGEVCTPTTSKELRRAIESPDHCRIIVLPPASNFRIESVLTVRHNWIDMCIAGSGLVAGDPLCDTQEASHASGFSIDSTLLTLCHLPRPFSRPSGEQQQGPGGQSGQPRHSERH